MVPFDWSNSKWDQRIIGYQWHYCYNSHSLDSLTSLFGPELCPNLPPSCCVLQPISAANILTPVVAGFLSLAHMYDCQPFAQLALIHVAVAVAATPVAQAFHQWNANSVSRGPRYDWAVGVLIFIRLAIYRHWPKMKTVASKSMTRRAKMVQWFESWTLTWKIQIQIPVPTWS